MKYFLVSLNECTRFNFFERIFHHEKLSQNLLHCCELVLNLALDGMTLVSYSRLHAAMIVARDSYTVKMAPDSN